jgi:hypothetical protein
MQPRIAETMRLPPICVTVFWSRWSKAALMPVFPYLDAPGPVSGVIVLSCARAPMPYGQRA